MYKDIKDFSLDELKSFLEKNNFPPYYAKIIFNWIYKKRIEDFDLMSDISKTARRFLKDNFYFSRLDLKKREISKDGTEKFLFRLKDNYFIETVLIPENKRFTICVSTQVGCKFGCLFCSSGISGFKRNLSVSEIINQYLEVLEKVYPKKITNIVFMGIGEPLDNFSNLVKAIKILIEPQGLYFGRRRICVSTVGIIPKIRELAKLKLGIKLSISLHSAFQELRCKIVPISKKYTLNEVIKVAKEFSKCEKYPITFEYILIKGFNTNRKDALELAKILKGINCKLNLIPCNLNPYNFEKPNEEELSIFKEELKKNKIFFTFRESRGSDINAGCGQLKVLWEVKCLE